MKQKIHFLIIVVLLGVFVSSCKKDEEEEIQVDNREQWLGNYVGVSEGDITISFLGQTQTIPLNGPVSFEIQKGSSINEILMVNDSITVRGIIDGTAVVFDPISAEQEYNDVLLEIVGNTTGTLSGDVINYDMIITGDAEYLGISIPVEGEVTAEATKQ